MIIHKHTIIYLNPIKNTTFIKYIDVSIIRRASRISSVLFELPTIILCLELTVINQVWILIYRLDYFIRNLNGYDSQFRRSTCGHIYGTFPFEATLFKVKRKDIESIYIINMNIRILKTNFVCKYECHLNAAGSVFLLISDTIPMLNSLLNKICLKQSDT